MPVKGIKVIRRVSTGTSGQGGVEYLILIAALIGLGTLVAYYWWSFAKRAGGAASPPGATKSATEAASKESSTVVQSYTSKMT
ncbi:MULTISPECIES: hypothetical protein [unclassified Methanopyrus]|uniref:hypothetical protein n=1 Tax=unclassified Methanopyrus TaxID=2684913 RepID=UPI000B4B1D76|nr:MULTISPECIES: hypothetical protein [unclassified Methanopyrus]